MAIKAITVVINLDFGSEDDDRNPISMKIIFSGIFFPSFLWRRRHYGHLGMGSRALAARLGEANKLEIWANILIIGI